MAADKNIEALLGTSMQNLTNMINVNTVVGEATDMGNGVSVVPISKVSVGFGAGGGEYTAKNEGEDLPFGGGAGGGMSVKPVGFLVANNGDVRFMSVEGNADAIDQVLEAIPGFLEKISSFFGKRKED